MTFRIASLVSASLVFFASSAFAYDYKTEDPIFVWVQCGQTIKAVGGDIKRIPCSHPLFKGSPYKMTDGHAAYFQLCEEGERTWKRKSRGNNGLIQTLPIYSFIGFSGKCVDVKAPVAGRGPRTSMKEVIRMAELRNKFISWSNNQLIYDEPHISSWRYIGLIGSTFSGVTGFVLCGAFLLLGFVVYQGRKVKGEVPSGAYLPVGVLVGFTVLGFFAFNEYIDNLKVYHTDLKSQVTSINQKLASVKVENGVGFRPLLERGSLTISETNKPPMFLPGITTLGFFVVFLPGLLFVAVRHLGDAAAGFYHVFVPSRHQGIYTEDLEEPLGRVSVGKNKIPSVDDILEGSIDLVMKPIDVIAAKNQARKNRKLKALLDAQSEELESVVDLFESGKRREEERGRARGRRRK